MNFILLQITCLIYAVLLNIFYFSKSHISSIENIIFKNLLILNVVGLVIDLGCFWSVSNIDVIPPVLNALITKSLLAYYLLFIFTYTMYVFVISYKNEKNSLSAERAYYKEISKKCLIAFIICTIVVTYLPLEYYNDGKYVYSYGLATDCLALILLVVMTLWIVVLVKRYENVKRHKYLPIIIFIVLAGAGGVIQKMYPQVLLTTPIETLVVFLMYFTIENPDMKLLQEAHRAKEVLDNANEEKAMFLYNMTQDIRNVTDEINDIADTILDSKDISEIHDGAREIKASTSKFNNMTNDIFDVSSVDATNIKVYNSKYNIKTLLKQLVNVYTDMCKNKELEFITNIDHDIPEMLYGDSISLKEVLNTVLSNATKYTSKGFVELSVNAIIRKDICRLIFTVEDSGVGIKSENVDKIKIEDKSLAKANKVLTAMNGALMLSSDYGSGTKVKIILDQKVVAEENTEISKYGSVLDNVKLLVIDDSEAGLKIIDKLLKNTKVIVDMADNGKESIDKLKVGKYDLILLDEELSQISGIELMSKFNEIRNFKTPVILLTKNNDYEYNEEYVKYGFCDYILKPIKRDVLIEKINKYTERDK